MKIGQVVNSRRKYLHTRRRTTYMIHTIHVFLCTFWPAGPPRAYELRVWQVGAGEREGCEKYPSSCPNDVWNHECIEIQTGSAQTYNTC